MPIATPVRYFDSTLPNAPRCSGTAGDMTEMLKACLVDGFDPRTVNSIVIADGIATVNISGGHAFAPLDVIRISGATPAALNDDWRVLPGATGSTLTFDVSGTGIGDGTATGTITARRAPAGWSMPYSDGHVCVFRPAAWISPRHFVRVDDTGTVGAQGARGASFRAYESMTDAHTGADPYPTPAQHADGLWLRKSTAVSTAARPWVVIADAGMCYVFTGPDGTTDMLGAAFGAFPSFRPDDAGNFLCIGTSSDTAIKTTSGQTPMAYCSPSFASYLGTTAINGHFLARDASQIAKSVPCYKIGSALSDELGGSRLNTCTGVPFPNGTDNAFLTSPVFICEHISPTVRGVMPGLYQPLHPAPLNHRDRISGVAGIPGDDCILVALFSSSTGRTGGGSSGAARAAFALVGPWR